MLFFCRALHSIKRGIPLAPCGRGKAVCKRNSEQEFIEHYSLGEGSIQRSFVFFPAGLCIQSREGVPSPLVGEERLFARGIPNGNSSRITALVRGRSSDRLFTFLAGAPGHLPPRWNRRSVPDLRRGDTSWSCQTGNLLGFTK